MIITLSTILNILEVEIGLPDYILSRVNSNCRLKEDLGLDSIDMAQLLINLEKLNPKLDVDVFFKEFRDRELTLNDLVGFVEKNS